MNEKVIAVNSILEAGEPDNISEDTYSGYSGYQPQSVIDALNEVLWGEWGFEELVSEITSGEKGGLAIAHVKVWIKGIDFQPTGWGQSRITKGDIGDARKGAQTDAIKKALSYFSIGNRAYKGLLDKKVQPSRPAQQPARTTPRQDASRMQQNGHNTAQPEQPVNAMQVQRTVSSDRLNVIYNRGKRLAPPLYANAEEFEVFVQHVLGLDEPIEVKRLTEAQAKDVETKIADRERQAKPTTKAS